MVGAPLHVLAVSCVALMLPALGASQSSRGDWFGWSVAELGDVDGDRERDWAIGCPFSYGFDDPTGVWVFSGGTGAVLAVLGVSHSDSGVGGWLANAGDVDGDARDDLAAYSGDERVTVWNVGGEVLLELPSRVWSTNDAPSIRLASSGDLDGDGRSDLLVGAKLYSGCDGRLLRDFPLPKEARLTSVATVADLDRDSLPEIVLCSERSRQPEIDVYSSGTGERLFHRAPLQEPDVGAQQARELWQAIRLGRKPMFGIEPHFAQDLDGDGLSEILLFVHFRLTRLRPMLALRGSDGAWHSSLDALTTPADDYLYRVLWLGDLDRDGRLESLRATDCFQLLCKSGIEAPTSDWLIQCDEHGQSGMGGIVQRVLDVSDRDGDGVRELLVSVFSDESPGSPGRVELRSGATGALLWSSDASSALGDLRRRR